MSSINKSGSSEFAAGRHIPALDGLRGVALLIVFVGHVSLFYDFTPIAHQTPITAFFSRNAGSGVDLFFVLSGFLITGILLDDKGENRFFRNFYARRTLRIFPVYYTALAIILITSAIAPNLAILKGLSGLGQLANWTYTTNILMAIQKWSAEPAAIGHFWSLSVEEQFYLAWPLVVCVSSRRGLFRICVLGMFGALAVRVILFAKGQSVAAYTLLPARMDTLLVGASLAILIRESSGFPRWITGKAFGLCTVGLFVLDQFAYQVAQSAPVGANLQLSKGVMLSGRVGIVLLSFHYTVTAVTFGVLLVAILSGSMGARVTSVFSMPVMRFFGRYSYAIYIFHLAVIIGLGNIIREAFPNIILFGLVALAISVTVALISWRLVERPFLALKDRYRPARGPISGSSGQDSMFLASAETET